MAKISVSLNEVLRDFIGQFTYTYNKYIKGSSIKEDDVTSLNLLEFFDFKSVDDLNRFLYLEETLEIFGHADQLHDGIMNHFNHFIMSIKDEGAHELEIVTKAVNNAIPSTLFFLSKTLCRAENIRFIQNSVDEWNGVDILITANPEALKKKPEGKISVKIRSSYNKDAPYDFELGSILELIKDESLRDKIFNTKITTYEEI